MQQHATLTGTVSDLFNHRFAIDTGNGKFLADLGKHNQETVTLNVGDKVELTGEQKPSELKVMKLIRNGSEVTLQQKHDKDHDKPKGDKHAHDTADANPQVATDAATKAGLRDLQEPVRKPKHFEVTGTDKNGTAITLHVEFDGTVRKAKSQDEKSGNNVNSKAA